MRNLIVTEFLSLDGVMEDPSWTFPYWNDDIAAFKAEETSADETLLLGRVTYEGFAAAWPGRQGDGAEYFNGTQKVVVSRTLTKAKWHNSTIIGENAAEEITRLKGQSGPDIVVHGSAALVQALMRHGLVDRYRLLVYPVVLGQGKRLFGEGATATLRLLETRAFASGVTALIYEPERA